MEKGDEVQINNYYNLSNGSSLMTANVHLIYLAITLMPSLAVC